MLYFLFILSLGVSLAAFVGVTLTEVFINKVGPTVRDILYTGGLCLIPVLNVMLVVSLLLTLTHSLWGRPYNYVARKVDAVLEFQLWPNRF